MKAGEIADLLKGEIEGNAETEITGVNTIEPAQRNEITFLANPLYEKYFHSTQAGAVLLAKDFELKDKREDIVIIRVQDPYPSFVILMEIFKKDEGWEETGISSYAVIGDDVQTGENIYIGDFVKIGNKCVIGNDSRINPNCSIDKGVIIGDNCIINPGVVIYKDCKIGNNVIIHANCVIGSDGFGYTENKDGSYKKIPQNGIVVIEDDVEIGSNTTIDRATIGETRICKGVKIDNQVQVGHNVYIGENTAIVSQTGIAGSTKIGNRCRIGGKVGMVGHITICDDVLIGAAVGVSKSISKPGIYTGYRAKPFKEELRQEALINKLSVLEERVKNIEKRNNK